MNIDRFRQTQKELVAKNLLGASDLAGSLTLFGEVVLTISAATVLASTSLWSTGFWAMQFVCGILIFHWFAILHECGHKTMFTRTSWNALAGHLASVFCMVPYHPWRSVHLAHHRWVGIIDKDPTQKGLLEFVERQPVKEAVFWILWKLWIPIPFTYFLYRVFWGYPVYLFKNLSPADRSRAIISVLVCLTIPVTLAFEIGALRAIAWFGPMLCGFYFLIENTNLPQHSELFPHLSDAHPKPIQLNEQDEVTRSTHLPDWLSTVMVLNFNRHTEHHLFPSAPWYTLNRLRRRLIASGYEHPHEVFFISFMLKLRRRDPMSVYRDALPQPLAAAE